MPRGDASRRRVRVLAVVVALAAIAIPAPATATSPSTIRDWNLYAVQALNNAVNAAAPTPIGAGQTPPVTSIHLAMVQGAVYDAVNSIDKSHRPYLNGLPAAPSTASINRAAATAAHHVLVGLLPQFPITAAFTTTVRDTIDARLDGLWEAAIAGVDRATDPGVLAGAAAASAMLASRTNPTTGLPSDNRFGPFRFPVPTDPQAGEWRPVLPAFVNDPFAWVGTVRPFTLESTGQYRTEGNPPMSSPEYAAEFNEVKRMGSLANADGARSPDQTALALFYRVDPVPVFNTTFRAIADARNLNPVQEARLFAMLSMSGADALINCWDDKAYWSSWRPITAIRLADTDGNPDTSPDTGWLPLIPTGTPPYPDQPSGYNCYTGAVFHTAQDFFGTDKVSFTVTSSGTGTAVTRNYTRFSAVWRDTIEARIWLGIHFRTPDVAGVWIGKHVAHWVDKHYFQAVK